LDTIERVEADTEKCCPVGLTLDMWTNNTPEVAAVPGQESLFASLLAQAADGGINCLCQPAVTLVRQRNNGFDPTCDNCDPRRRRMGQICVVHERPNPEPARGRVCCWRRFGGRYADLD